MNGDQRSRKKSSLQHTLRRPFFGSLIGSHDTAHFRIETKHPGQTPSGLTYGLSEGLSHGEPLALAHKLASPLHPISPYHSARYVSCHAARDSL